jgi:hypothetical protein
MQFLLNVIILKCLIPKRGKEGQLHGSAGEGSCLAILSSIPGIFTRQKETSYALAFTHEPLQVVCTPPLNKQMNVIKEKGYGVGAEKGNTCRALNLLIVASASREKADDAVLG